ncbi:hypothetical protein ACQEVZ_51530 [Dactylosporangium sp. CA-152071]
MGYGFLRVGHVALSDLEFGPPPEFLAVFLDSMYRRRTSGEPYRDVIHELVGEGPIIADRLDALGYTPARAMEVLDELLDAARARDWSDGPARDPRITEAFSSADWFPIIQAELAAGERPWHPDEPAWDLGIGYFLSDQAQPYMMRLLLLADPQLPVRLDFTKAMYEWERDEPDALCADALTSLRSTGATYAPTVVLTEGSSDVSVLQSALKLLYPHLVDLVRFMDFGERPPGGAGPLVSLVRGFAAAGIANRVIALFDNDSAATEALSKLDQATLPDNIRVRQYPRLDLAANYPALGPPTLTHPSGWLATADVNGLACSIELYLGRDVLTGPDGALVPVQWTSYLAGPRQYQGAIAEKRAVHERFRAKAAAASTDPAVMAGQDWSGLQAIIHTILHAFD